MQPEELSRVQPPPRDLPADVRLLVRLASVEGLMFFLALTALLAGGVVPNTDWRSLLFMKGVESAPGTVLTAEERGWEESNQTVWRVRFELERGGRKESGDSHFVGSRPQIGDLVQIEWPRGFPAITRIEGGRTGPLHAGTLAVLLFPLFVLMMIQAQLKQASRVIQGLRDGVPTEKGGMPGLGDPTSGLILASLHSIPTGVGVGFDGVWALDTASRLIRPAVLSGLGVTSFAFLAWTLFETGNQL